VTAIHAFNVVLSYRPSRASLSKVDAVCFNNATNLGAGCPINSNLDSANDYLNKQFVEQQRTDYKVVLSVLFNAFIMCQVGVHKLNLQRLVIIFCQLSFYRLILPPPIHCSFSHSVRLSSLIDFQRDLFPTHK
jgi:hypothetical protein